MNTFTENLLDASLRTTTENGCATYRKTLNANLNFFSQASAMRGNYVTLLNLFSEAFDEDKLIAIRNLFYLRDIRGGQGERSSFRHIFKFVLDKLSPSEYSSVIYYIPIYGRWDDVLDILKYMTSNPEKYKEQIDSTLKMIQQQLIKDIGYSEQSKPISLLAKWFPLENNTKNQSKKQFARFLCHNFFKSQKDARQTIVKLRKYLSVTEQFTSSNRWNDIVYSSVPSKANLKYRYAFMRHDTERYTQYLSDVSSGKQRINSQALYPYEIIRQVMKIRPNDAANKQLEALWNNLPNYISENSSIVVVDVSGSMYNSYNYKFIKPIDISVSLGLYYAEKNNGPFKNIFITFSEKPQVEVIKGNTFYERVYSIIDSNWGMNTNIVDVFELYLKLAKESKPEDLPKNIIIVSDMEFDECSDMEFDECSERNSTAFEYINKMFEKEGIKRPTLVFWNVDSSGENIPVKFDENGTVLLSGFSPAILSYVMEGKNPVQFMLDVLMSERYYIIEL